MYDDLILGTGMAGLTVAALLANSGRRVLMLEAHDTPGGYAHSFAMGKYRFCAQVHYIFGCGEGEPVHRLLHRLGLAEEVRFNRLDPEGFDQVVVGGERFKIPNGLPKSRDRLIQRFPDAARPLARYFATLIHLREETTRLPDRITWRDLASAPLRFPRLLRYKNWTLQEYYDHVKMPRKLQAVLAGQSGDYLLPPEQVSFLLHVALVCEYDRGAYYPQRHFSHLVDSVADSIKDRPGCRILLEHEVTGLDVRGDRVVGVRTKSGEIFRARRYISNIDPSTTMRLAGISRASRASKKRFDYEYSTSNFTLYLGLRGVDLREHGFGDHNVWHYPHDDINRMYRVQVQHHDLSNPWLFMATPTLHSDAPGLAPAGEHVLEVATSCDYEHFRRLRDQPGRAYTEEKILVRDRILDIIEANYIPDLRKHMVMRVAGTPVTNERFCRAPRGNAYGAALTPQGMRLPRTDNTTPLSNLFSVNATAGYPSIGGTVSSGLRLFDRLVAEQ